VPSARAIALPKRSPSIGFVAGTIDDLYTWIQHLDAVGVEHSPLVTALAGQLLVFPDSDGT